MTSTRQFNVAIMPGDGIGPEVTDAALAVLDAALDTNTDITLEYEHLAAGAAAWRETGSAMTEEVFERAKTADAILLGAMGLPDVRHDDGTEIAPQLDLRFRLGLYAGVRPVRALAGGARPLADPRGADIDLVIVRESTEGLFASRGKGTVEDDRIARDTMIITRETCERLFDASFRLAARRKAHGARRQGQGHLRGQVERVRLDGLLPQGLRRACGRASGHRGRAPLRRQGNPD